MKTSAVALLLSLTFLAPSFAMADKWAAQWKKVDDAVQQGLPKTAIEQLQPILDAATTEKNYPVAIKAIGRKIALEGVIQGNKPEEKITRLDAEIAKAPAEMRPMLEVVQAQWYWQYFLHNRWRFMQRTATSAPPGKDFTTWDLARLFAEIDKHFQAALSAADQLKKIPVADYNDLLDKGSLPDDYRPTLYDFVANQALDFYNAGEQAGAKAEDAFELAADGPIFQPVGQFLAWKPDLADAESPTLKAVRLYQQLLRFHKNGAGKFSETPEDIESLQKRVRRPDLEAERTAFLDVDLARLKLGHNKAVGEEKAVLYKTALRRFIKENLNNPLSAMARFHLAEVVREENELVDAHDVAAEGWRMYPQSPGGILCYNLVKQIEAKSANIMTERVWNEPWPVIRVNYTNVTKVYFRLIRQDWTARMRSGRYRGEYLDDAERRTMLARQPDRAWSADLPPTEDYRNRAEDVPVPKDLKPGYYFLLSSHDAGFSGANNVVSFTEIWVSKLALVLRQQNPNTRFGGFVLDAATGEPIAAADVQVYAWNWNNQFLLGEKVRTDRNGLFSAQGVANYNNLLYVTHAGQALTTANNLNVYNYNNRPTPQKQVVFFTDRSLYRPGQTIYYKGIAILVDQDGDNYQVVPRERLSIIFSDVNGKEIARQSVVSNDYGSVSGSFTAPRDRLMGRMMLHVDQVPGGTPINVEEYKRPKFQVTLDAPKTAPRLGGEVEIPGKAMAYTGATIGGAKVRYRVVREVRYPDWWYWCFAWRMPQQAGSQEITHGTAETAADGTFTIKFMAKPDPTVAEKDEPIFRYAVTADVTDTNGETRTGERAVQAGYTALKASLSAKTDWIVAGQPLEITVTTTTLDGEPQKAEGALRIYRLKQPEKVERTDILGQRPVRPVRQVLGRGRRVQPVKPVPPTPAPDPSNPNTWELGEMVAEQGMTTDASGTASWTTKLEAGAYRAKFETQDRFNKRVTALLPLNVMAPDAKKFPIKVANMVVGPKWSLEPGDDFLALWGSGYEQARAYMEIEHRGKIIKSFWTETGATQQPIKLAVTDGLRGGFQLHVTMVSENRAYLESRRVDVPWTNKDLKLKWEHFVSKMEPGQKETWTAVISGPDAKKAVAEMVATLYDESLDAYLPHGWPSGFGVFRQDYSQINMSFENMAKYLNQVQGGWPLDQKAVEMRYRALPSSITVDLWGYGYFGEGGGMGGRARGGVMLGRMAVPSAAAPAAPMMMERRGLAMDADKADSFAVESALAANGAQAKKPAAAREQEKQSAGEGPGRLGAGPDLSQVAARKNLNETAFFFPHLLSDSEGQVKMEFTMPEALTKWKFLGFAHDAQLRGGLLSDSAVTAKDLMVQPNPPRFLREGDMLEFTVKVTNMSDTHQTGSVRLSFSDARTGKPFNLIAEIPPLFNAVRGGEQGLKDGFSSTDQYFDLAAKASESFSWRLSVPDMSGGAITYKAVSSTGRVSDGEEGLLPVLLRRTLVQEALPLPIRGPATKNFRFDRLLKSGDSKTLQSQSLTVQMVSNPSWYAVMALPYLMEYPYECYEQTFNRLYANALARHIANSDPKIHRVFEQWKGTPALDSPLEKNQDLKSVMLEETPWVRQAESESQARRNVGILFDDNRLNDETARAMKKLAEGQYADGAWPWFPGGPPNDYITLYITTGYGRLRHLGVKLDMQPAFKSLERLDAWIDREYREIVRLGHKDDDQLNPDDRLLSLRPQLLPRRPANRGAAQGGRRLLPRPGPQVLAQAGRPPVAGPSGRRSEAFRRQGHRPGDHALDQGTIRHRTKSWACSGATPSFPARGSTPRSRRRP